MPRRVPLAAAALLAMVATAPAQMPAGPEFRVNSYTTGTQTRPAVAARPDGSFVVVWHGYAGGSTSDVTARMFDAAGMPLGPEFLVHAPAGLQLSPHVASDQRNGFIVVWEGFTGGGPFAVANVYARRFAASGAPLGPEFLVNTVTTVGAGKPVVAMGRDGAFLVTWQEFGTDGDLYGILGRRFDAWGSPVGADFAINSYTTGSQQRPRAAALPGGAFVVVWDGPDDFANGVWARRFDAAGTPLGPEQQVATALAGQSLADLAAGPDGSSVVVWTSYAQDGSHNGVFGRRFAAGGLPSGGEFRVNTYTTGGQDHPRVTTDSAGHFVVAWQSNWQDGSAWGAFGRRFTAGAVPRGPEFQVNTHSPGYQQMPAVATDGAGNILAAWDSTPQDGSGPGIFAQRYGGLRPQALAVTAEGNGILEVPEDFGLLTSWRNATGSTQTFQGAVSDPVVPQGLSLTLGNTATYGPVPDGAVGSCVGVCFSGALLGTRPTGHVDLSFLETIQPEAQGQVQRWVLHVGGSFSDVPRTNPYYRFVETLLHRDITGGCSATQYCPAHPTTREQMAVFVLVAREGSGYAPPPCSPPNLFGDVPETSPFCRWIEELAQRGVVSGCQASPPLYCPADPVTREQMAVFVLRTLDPALDPPACVAGSEMFADVPASSPFCRWIEELARRGVVTGCGGGNYCPTAPVTREQMGVFISVTFGLSLYGV